MFCYQCGKSESELIEGLCYECFIKEFSILTVPKEISVKICTYCNAKFNEGKWINANLDEEEIIYRSIENSIEINPIAENPIIDMNILQMRGTIAESTVEAKVNIFKKEIYEKHKVNIRLNKDICPTCSKRNSGYYESVIQIRSQVKKIESGQLKEIDMIINKTLEKLYKKDKLAYIPTKNKIKEGVDYYIGSLKSGRKLALAIKKSFGGMINESERLVTKNKSTGKEIYRVWIAIRLPNFNKGDFIKFNNKIAKILNINRKKIVVIDLDNDNVFNISWNMSKDIELLKKSTNIKKTIVISRSPKILQILNPDTFEIVDFPINQNTQNYSTEDEIQTVFINNKLYIV
jgi:nonsense-mediated mRNA decay protein 3